MSQYCEEEKRPAPGETPCCCGRKEAPRYQTVSSDWSREDTRGQILCRVSDKFRSDYCVEPGLYALGNASEESPVFVSANYRLSFNVLRRALRGIDCRLLVLDTKGINVWCAAGKGTFGTAELVRRIRDARLDALVKHRSVIAPQLGAPGVSAHEVRAATGFRVLYGPVRAQDIPAYLAAGNIATRAMRTVEFPLGDRLVLTPMELSQILRKKTLWIIAVLVVVMGIQPSGIIFKAAIMNSWPILLAGLVAALAGSFITPALLPIIPFRSFAAKGALMGAIVLSPTLLFVERFFQSSALLVSAFLLFFTVLASYCALNFTGCTPFTNISGVKKEMRFAVPAYIAACAGAAVLLIGFKLREWGVL
jgi:hypothetical protein